MRSVDDALFLVGIDAREEIDLFDLRGKPDIVSWAISAPVDAVATQSNGARDMLHDGGLFEDGTRAYSTINLRQEVIMSTPELSEAVTAISEQAKAEAETRIAMPIIAPLA